MLNRDYIPAAQRQRRRQLADVERENIHLRQRLSAMFQQLQHAHEQMRAVKQWQALIDREAANLASAVRQATANFAPEMLKPTIERERGFIAAEKCADRSHPLYIADRWYAMPLLDHKGPTDE
jgi:hypothetical protein